MAEIKLGEVYVIRCDSNSLAKYKTIWNDNQLFKPVYEYIRRYKPSNWEVSAFDQNGNGFVYESGKIDVNWHKWKVRCLSPLIISNERGDMLVPYSSGMFSLTMMKLPVKGTKVKITKVWRAKTMLGSSEKNTSIGDRTLKYINLHKPCNVIELKHWTDIRPKSYECDWVVQEVVWFPNGYSAQFVILSNQDNEMAVVMLDAVAIQE